MVLEWHVYKRVERHMSMTIFLPGTAIVQCNVVVYQRHGHITWTYLADQYCLQLIFGIMSYADNACHGPQL